METITLHIKEAECEGTTCPPPLPVIATMEDGIEQIQWDEKTEEAKITFDESKWDREKIIAKLKDNGYEVA